MVLSCTHAAKGPLVQAIQPCTHTQHWGTTDLLTHMFWEDLPVRYEIICKEKVWASNTEQNNLPITNTYFVVDGGEMIGLYSKWSIKAAGRFANEMGSSPPPLPNKEGVPWPCPRTPQLFPTGPPSPLPNEEGAPWPCPCTPRSSPTAAIMADCPLPPLPKEAAVAVIELCYDVVWSRDVWGPTDVTVIMMVPPDDINRW